MLTPESPTSADELEDGGRLEEPVFGMLTFELPTSAEELEDVGSLEESVMGVLMPELPTTSDAVAETVAVPLALSNCSSEDEDAGVVPCSVWILAVSLANGVPSCDTPLETS